MLREMLESVRELRLYWQPKAGEVHRVKGLMRKAGVRIPLPRRCAAKQRQLQGLDDMMEASTRLGLYDGELNGLLEHPKRGGRGAGWTRD